MIFRAEIDLDATPQEVFTVLTDFARYPAWNPFTIEAKVGPTAPGSVVDLLVVMNAQTRWQRLTMRTFTPPVRETDGVLAWGMSWPLALRAERVQRVTRVGGRTRYVSSEEMTGPLARVVDTLYGETIRDGLNQLTTALVRRVELEQVTLNKETMR